MTTPTSARALYQIQLINPHHNGQIQHTLWAEGPARLVRDELVPLMSALIDEAPVELGSLAVKAGPAVTWTPGVAIAELANVVQALTNASGNQRKAAAALGLSYATMRRRVDELGLAEWLRAAYPLAVRQPARKDT